MFASRPSSDHRRARPPVPAGLRQKITPLIPASARTLPVTPALETLLPGGSLRRGTTTLVTGAAGSGATSLGIALLAGASHAGHWCASVGLDDPGVVAMAELGLDLRRVVFVPSPRGAWAEAAAELLEGVELLLVRVPGRVSAPAARRLVARVRDRRAALVVLAESSEMWPTSPELTLAIDDSRWQGAGFGEGRLQARRAHLTIEGRGGVRAQSASVWLPSPRGEITLAGTPG